MLVMSVNPGFGGQKFIASQLKKVEAIANMAAKKGLDARHRGRWRDRPGQCRVGGQRRRDRVGRGHRRLPRRARPLRRQYRGASGRFMKDDDVVGRLAKPSLMARLFGASRTPLRLVAVPRDHVVGDRARGDALLAGRLLLGSETINLAEVDFATLGTQSPLGARNPGLRLAARPCRRRQPRPGRAARRGDRRALADRPRHAHRRCLGGRIMGQPDPVLDRLRALHPVEPRRRLSLGLAQHAGAGRASILPPPPTRPRRDCRGLPPGRASSPPR